jgi:ADP-heptose:LPS heptosyltransferase
VALPRFEPRSSTRPRVAVWREQGIGDQVLFSTLLPDLHADAVACVEVDERLAAAYRRSLPEMRFATPGESAAAFAQCDAQVALGSLARLYRPDPASFARQPRALLRADDARVRSMRAALGEGPFIGISWRSVQAGTRRGTALRKSIPLAHFARLAQSRGMRLLDLQYGDVDAERAEFAAAHPGLLVRPPGLDAFADLEGVLAAIEACERVITASNATAHFAGALGKAATVVFLEARAPFHYWDAVEGSRSLWYPSVEVATSPSWRRWEEAFEALAARPG